MINDARCKHEGSHVLLVEGIDDCHVVRALCNAYAVPETFGVFECGSDQLVLRRLNALIASPPSLDAPQVIGVVLDADNNLSGRWDSLKSKIGRYGYVLQDQPDSSGTILECSPRLRLGFWLMPNNQLSGLLEHFCMQMIDPHIDSYVREVVVRAQETAGACSFKTNHFEKAVVHTYLAWQDEPGYPLGKAITKQSLRPLTQTAKVFVAWLNRLFNSPI